LFYLFAKAWSLLVGLSIPQVRLLSYGFALLAVASFVVFHTRYRLIWLFVLLLLLGSNPLFTCNHSGGGARRRASSRLLAHG
jgi:NhaP-type Na+/H+ or K+/H+ antiporter